VLFAFPPCTTVAVSGARWFKGKGLGGLIEALQLFDVSLRLAEWTRAPYMIENPVSTVSTYWRKPDYTFDPFEFAGYAGPADAYTKRTCLWTGTTLLCRRAVNLRRPWVARCTATVLPLSVRPPVGHTERDRASRF